MKHLKFLSILIGIVIVLVSAISIRVGMAQASGEFLIQQGGTATGTAQTNGIWFYDGISFKQDLNNLVWDISNTRLGIGTSTPGSTFSVGGIANFTTATSTFYGSGGINITDGCFAIDGTCFEGGGGGGTPGGSDTQVQFNDSGSFAGSAGFSYDKNNGYLTLGTSTHPIVISPATGNTRGINAVDIGSRLVATEVASGQESTVVGYRNTASAQGATSIGWLNTASAFGATALGFQNSASATGATSLGYANTSSQGGVALGVSNTNAGSGYSFAIGASNSVSGSGYGGVGHNLNVSGSQAYAFGYAITNSLANSVQIGPSDASKISITTTGLGIGTTTPFTKLGVAGTITANNINATSTTATSTFSGGVQFGAYGTQYNDDANAFYIDSLYSGALSFPSDAGVVSALDMPVTSSSADGTKESYSFQLDGNPVATVYATSTGSGGIYSANFGVGTTSPWKKFSVDGNVAMTGLNTSLSGTALCILSTGEVVSAGNVACDGSNEFIKDDVQTLKIKALEVIELLRPISYQPINPRSSHTDREIGFLAGEVAKILPEVVEFEEDGVTARSINYGRLSAVFVVAFGEQQEQIEDLQKQINSINREKQGVTPFNIGLLFAILGLGVLVIKKK